MFGQMTDNETFLVILGIVLVVYIICNSIVEIVKAKHPNCDCEETDNDL